MTLDHRSAARLAVVQALYQMEVSGKGINEIFAEFESHWMGREIEGVQYKPAGSRLIWNINVDCCSAVLFKTESHWSRSIQLGVSYEICRF
jgi:transcription termination factor NusB